MKYLFLFIFIYFNFNYTQTKNEFILKKFKNYIESLRSKNINNLNINEYNEILNKLEEIIINLTEIKSNFLNYTYEIYNKLNFLKYKKFNDSENFNIYNNKFISSELKNKINKFNKKLNNENFILNINSYLINTINEKIKILNNNNNNDDENILFIKLFNGIFKIITKYIKFEDLNFYNKKKDKILHENNLLNKFLKLIKTKKIKYKDIITEEFINELFELFIKDYSNIKNKNKDNFEIISNDLNEYINKKYKKNISFLNLKKSYKPLDNSFNENKNINNNYKYNKNDDINLNNSKYKNLSFKIFNIINFKFDLKNHDPFFKNKKILEIINLIENDLSYTNNFINLNKNYLEEFSKKILDLFNIEKNKTNIKILLDYLEIELKHKNKKEKIENKNADQFLIDIFIYTKNFFEDFFDKKDLNTNEETDLLNKFLKLNENKILKSSDLLKIEFINNLFELFIKNYSILKNKNKENFKEISKELIKYLKIKIKKND